MKFLYGLLIICLVVFTASSKAQDDTLNVLFIGNSYTYFNELPQIFVDLSQSGEKPVIVDFNAPGGYTLESHSTNTITIDKISRGTWDYVVLQEQSQIPTIDYWRYNSMYPAARSLDTLITAYSQHTAFFMTWGRKYGGQQTVGAYSSPVFVDFFHMQDSLSSAYTQISNELNATLCPVGNAWANAFSIDTTIDLWQNDFSHPTLQGSYLSACVFYAVFFEESPLGLAYTAGLSMDEALFLQQVAERTVLSVPDQSKAQPLSFTLYQNYPNPFNSSTTIRYDLHINTRVTLRIYDILGREIITLADTYQTKGPKSLLWNGNDETGIEVGSGVYLCRLQTDNGAICRKFVHIK